MKLCINAPVVFLYFCCVASVVLLVACHVNIPSVLRNDNTFNYIFMSSGANSAWH